MLYNLVDRMTVTMTNSKNKFGYYFGGAFIIGVILYLFLSTYYFGNSATGPVRGQFRSGLEVKIDISAWSTPESEFYDIFLKSMLNLPQWYRRGDWGLRKNVSLENASLQKDVYPGGDAEEMIAWNNFFFGTSNGIVLELGAMEGARYSVSRFFETEAEWRSILIEGNPIMAAALPQNRANAINFNAVICEKPRTVHFVQYADMSGILEFMAQGFLTKYNSDLVTNGSLDEKKIDEVRRVIKVPCVPLSVFLYPLKIYHINYFVLDVEGGELNVLKAIDFEKIKFDVLSVETDRETDSQVDTKNYVDAVIELLSSKGYVLWNRKLGRNSWFKHSNFTGFSKNQTERGVELDQVLVTPLNL